MRQMGRPSVPPERLLKGLLLIALHSIRSERQFCEQLQYNLLFRWFLDMDMLEQAFDASTFSRNRERLLEHEVAAEFFAAVRTQAAGLMSREHFSVDGTLLKSWASMKSFREKDDDNGDHNGWGDFRGEQRSNDTHESKTDPEAKLMRKGRGREAKLCLRDMPSWTIATGSWWIFGYCERETALEMLAEHANGRVTVGADRGYDTADFVAGCRRQGVTPHVAMNDSRRRSAIDRRTTRHVGYGISQTIRMRIEQVFGWVKSIGGLRRSRFRGKRRTQLAAYMVGAAYNLLRLNKLLTVAP